MPPRKNYLSGIAEPGWADLISGINFWDTLADAVEIFGAYQAGVHLIVGLGETEAEMVNAISRAYRMGAMTHLFSFYPESGSLMQDSPPPALGKYRRVQLARYLINEGIIDINDMHFSPDGQIIDFGRDIMPYIQNGEAFMTSGCPGEDGQVACNRPFGNDRGDHERADRDHGADREEQERRDRGDPRRPAQLLRVDPQLLARERVERAVAVSPPTIGCDMSRAWLGLSALRLVDEGELLLLLVWDRASSSRSTLTWWAKSSRGALDREPLAEGHRERPGQQPGETGDQDRCPPGAAPATPMRC